MAWHIQSSHVQAMIGLCEPGSFLAPLVEGAYVVLYNVVFSFKDAGIHAGLPNIWLTQVGLIYQRLSACVLVLLSMCPQTAFAIGTVTEALASQRSAPALAEVNANASVTSEVRMVSELPAATWPHWSGIM